jgi:hypothetical protein
MGTRGESFPLRAESGEALIERLTSNADLFVVT